MTSDRETMETRQWVVGLNEAGDMDDWVHHHPRAETEDEARNQALGASDFVDPCVYMAEVVA